MSGSTDSQKELYLLQWNQDGEQTYAVVVHPSSGVRKGFPSLSKAFAYIKGCTAEVSGNEEETSQNQS